MIDFLAGVDWPKWIGTGIGLSLAFRVYNHFTKKRDKEWA